MPPPPLRKWENILNTWAWKIRIICFLFCICGRLLLLDVYKLQYWCVWLGRRLFKWLEFFSQFGLIACFPPLHCTLAIYESKHPYQTKNNQSIIILWHVFYIKAIPLFFWGNLVNHFYSIEQHRICLARAIIFLVGLWNFNGNLSRAMGVRNFKHGQFSFLKLRRLFRKLIWLKHATQMSTNHFIILLPQNNDIIAATKNFPRFSRRRFD